MRGRSGEPGEGVWVQVHGNVEKLGAAAVGKLDGYSAITFCRRHGRTEVEGMTGVGAIELGANERHAILAVFSDGNQVQRLVTARWNVHAQSGRIESIRGDPASAEQAEVAGNITRQGADARPARADVHVIVAVGAAFVNWYGTPLTIVVRYRSIRGASPGSDAGSSLLFPSPEPVRFPANRERLETIRDRGQRADADGQQFGAGRDRDLGRSPKH